VHLPTSSPLRSALLLLSVLAAVASPLAAKPIPAVPAPAWSLKDVDGKVVTSADFAGKVVVIDFWATWCPPCRTEIPGYVALQKKYDGQVVFLGVSVDSDDKVGDVKAFIKDYKVNYPILMLGDSDIQDQFKGITGYPTTYIIGTDGKIHARKVGREPTADFEKEILAVLRPAAP
jgi:thiol-disulfide isomerase/thioredoxin